MSAKSPSQSETGKISPVEIRGVGVSPGVVIGQVLMLSVGSSPVRERVLKDEEIPREALRFQEALLATRAQIQAIQQRMADAIGEKESQIMDAHLLMVDDHSFIQKVVDALNERKKNAEAIIGEVTEYYVHSFSKMNDNYVKERVADLRDVTRRIQRNLQGTAPNLSETIEKGTVIIAVDLAPSETAMLDPAMVSAFATDQGSSTSHTAITARSLEIPAVVALQNITSRVKDGDTVLVDGTSGVVIVNPTSEQKLRYGQLGEAREDIINRLKSLSQEPAETADGRKIGLMANIESVGDARKAREQGAGGVGLFRTEYLFLSRDDLPTEDEQAEAYAEITEVMKPDPVVIRTLDIGGDKIASHLEVPAELNPFLGWRGIRFCLAQPDIFLTQLRAVLRASTGGNVKIMFPMISNRSEVIQAIEFLEKAKAQLREKNIPFDENLEVGVMIEVPAAALSAGLIAPEVKFFSIGTNDLIQYTIAVDRLNERVAGLYEPTHPAILKLLSLTTQAGNQAGIDVAVCGQMAGNPILVPLLIGLGVGELSLSPAAIPVVKCVLRGVTYLQCTELAQKALEASSAEEVLAACRQLVAEVAPEIMELFGEVKAS
jgi:phosphotransferase system enzyme I (PtsI)